MLQDIKLGPRAKQLQLKPLYVAPRGKAVTSETKVQVPGVYGRQAMDISDMYLWREDKRLLELLPQMAKVVVGSQHFPITRDGKGSISNLFKASKQALDSLAGVMSSRCHLRNDELQPKFSVADVTKLDAFRFPLIKLNAPLNPICMDFDKGKVAGVKGMKLHSHGYLKIKLGWDRQKQLVVWEKAHRLVCWAFHGPPPAPGSVVMHTCNTPSCLSPKHLKWGNQRQNSQGRKQPGKRRGAKVKGRKGKKEEQQ